MQIASVALFQDELVLKTRFGLSGGRVVETLSSTILRIKTGTGLTGWGESCPWGSDYLAAFPEAIREGVRQIAPNLIGQDPRNLAQIEDIAEACLRGQPAILSAVDMACSDLASQIAGIPMSHFLGGVRTATQSIPGGIGQTPGEACAERIADWRAKGVRQMSAKASGEAEADIALVRFVLSHLQPGEIMKIDANGGWDVANACRVAVHCDDRVIIEQPCADYESCRSFVRQSGRGYVMDELALCPQDILRAHNDGLLTGVNIKIGRVGGMSRARLMRDLCIALHLPMYIQDTGGSAIARAAVAHLAAAVPHKLMLGVWDPAAVLQDPRGEGGAQYVPSTLTVGEGAGLGVKPSVATKEPIWEVTS